MDISLLGNNNRKGTIIIAEDGQDSILSTHL